MLLLRWKGPVKGKKVKTTCQHGHQTRKDSRRSCERSKWFRISNILLKNNTANRSTWDLHRTRALWHLEVTAGTNEIAQRWCLFAERMRGTWCLKATKTNWITNNIPKILNPKNKSIERNTSQGKDLPTKAPSHPGGIRSKGPVNAWTRWRSSCRSFSQHIFRSFRPRCDEFQSVFGHAAWVWAFFGAFLFFCWFCFWEFIFLFT